jgi:hypothetical protein
MLEIEVVEEVANLGVEKIRFKRPFLAEFKD